MIPEQKVVITNVGSETENAAVLINLSNHPVGQWSDKQRAAAAVYGEVMDMPFPAIEPSANEDEIHELANSYVRKILEVGSSPNITVHIMGEMTFTFSVVERLKAMGVRCVASTTQRNVTEQNGQKTSIFEFIKFREY